MTDPSEWLVTYAASPTRRAYATACLALVGALQRGLQAGADALQPDAAILQRARRQALEARDELIAGLGALPAPPPEMRVEDVAMRAGLQSIANGCAEAAAGIRADIDEQSGRIVPGDLVRLYSAWTTIHASGRLLLPVLSALARFALP